MGDWHLNPAEPCCNPATDRETRAQLGVPDGVDGRCGNCQRVPEHWKLTVPANTIRNTEFIDNSVLNGIHILTRVRHTETNPFLIPEFAGEEVGEDFLKCEWNVVYEHLGAIPSPKKAVYHFSIFKSYAGWNVGFAIDAGFGARIGNSPPGPPRWTASTLRGGFSPIGGDSFLPTNSIWLLERNSVFRCLDSNEFVHVSDAFVESLPTDPDQILTIEPWYP